jgi:hypothetical protein
MLSISEHICITALISLFCLRKSVFASYTQPKANDSLVLIKPSSMGMIESKKKTRPAGSIFWFV